MSIINKFDNHFPNDGGVTFKDTFYKADFMIKFPVDNDEINLENCTCVFSILNRSNLLLRQYVGAKFYDLLTKENIIESVNGYLPETVFCFTSSDFPLSEFLDESNFQHHNS